MRPRAGVLRTPYWIQEAVETQNARGEIVIAYSNVMRWRAERVTGTAAERLASQQVHGTRTLLLRGRYIPNFTFTSKHVLYDGTVRYDIEPPTDHDGRREALEIVAIQRAA